MENAPTTPKVFLIPNLLGDQVSLDTSLPAYVATIVSRLVNFVVEDEKSARRLIKKLAPQLEINKLAIKVLNQHTHTDELEELMAPLLRGESLGVISEAGCPAIADPGAEIVKRAHILGVSVVPLVGPCSMMLALMASGLNGQAWRFQGYLPIDPAERTQQIQALDKRVRTLNETQIIMDTPYRNERLFRELIGICTPDTRLCVAQGLTTLQESILTATVKQWHAKKIAFDKVPALFLIGL